MRFLNVTWAKLSLRARVLLLTGAVLIGSGVIFQYVEAQRTVDEYRQDISAEMDNTMDLLVLAIGEQAVTGDHGAIRRILGTRVEKPLIDEIRWRDRDGRVLEAKSIEIAPRAPALFGRLINLKPEVQSRAVVVGGVRYGTVSAHFTGVLHENLLWDRYLRQLGSLVVYIVALFLVVWFLLKNGLKPIESLAAAARRFLAGDLEAHVKISPGMPPEIRDTLRMVNRAADRIGSLVLSLSEVRRATDNAAIVVESDLNGVITYANDKFCEISGYSLAELVGSDHRFLNSGHHPPSFFAELWATVSQGNVWRGEVCNRTKNGGLFWTNTTITPIVGPDGKPLKYVAIRFDTTRRKLAESKLWQQAQIIEQTHDAVFSMDPDGNVASWNRGAERLFGYSREEAMGRPIRFLYPDEECDFFRVEALKAKGADSLETALRRKSGDRFDAHLSLTMLRDRNGTVIGMVGYAIDITARKLAENALRKSEAGLARAQQMAHIGNWEWNIEKNTLRWSEEVYRIFGLMPQQFGASYEAFMNAVHPGDRESVQAAVNAALRGTPYCIDHRVVLPDGRLRFVHEQAEVTFDQNGKAIRMVGTVQDITERKRAMAELDRFKNVLDNTLDMIFMFDPDTLHFVYLNRGAVEGMGYAREELLRMTAYQIKPLLPEPVFRELIAPLLSGEKPSLSFETVHRHKDGTDFPVEIFLQLVKQGEGKGLFIAIGRDITERKRAEMEIRESREQLRELSSYIQTAREQEKAKIAREIHDELGSTLTALKMDAFWLAKKLPAEMDALREKVASMMKLVDSAVHATRRIATELRPTVLDDIGLKAAIEWQASEFQNRMGIRCEVDLGQDEFELDEARSIALFRIFQESLTNIARHANASHVSARLRRSGDHIAMSIRDNGCGISQERISKSRSHGVRGMFERARHLGGNVMVEGTEGRGTTITVHIPLLDREETETA